MILYGHDSYFFLYAKKLSGIKNLNMKMKNVNFRETALQPLEKIEGICKSRGHDKAFINDGLPFFEINSKSPQ